MGFKHNTEIVDKILELKIQGKSSRNISQEVFGKKTSKSTVNDIVRQVVDGKRETSIEGFSTLVRILRNETFLSYILEDQE